LAWEEVRQKILVGIVVDKIETGTFLNVAMTADTDRDTGDTESIQLSQLAIERLGNVGIFTVEASSTELLRALVTSSVVCLAKGHLAVLPRLSDIPQRLVFVSRSDIHAIKVTRRWAPVLILKEEVGNGREHSA
jgi:hypothetical protein